jgi:hypothetical protein
MEHDKANEQDDISDSELQAICNQVESELAKNGPLSYEELNREIDAMNEQSSAKGIGAIVPRVVIATKTKGPRMSTRKKGNEGALKAAGTKSRRGKPPEFDTSTPEEARILRQAYRAASAAISRASKKDLEFDEKWMLNSHNQIIAQKFRCAVTGLEFHLDKHKTKGAGGTHMAPSPDRIDAERGYVEDNVRWVLWAVNRAKGEMPHELFVEICRAVVKCHDAQG